MANLSSLIHELRERIAAACSSSSVASAASAGEDPLEARFRVVLPNLLHAYVVPSSAAKEREVTAVLKLLSHTARNFPGVFFHGKTDAVFPVLRHVLPFLAEPAFRSCHELIFDTAATLLSLLRTGDRDAYRQFFLEAMAAVEDISYVASLKRDMGSSRSVSLKCFCESFAVISTSSSLFCEAPSCHQLENGAGIVVDLGDNLRWQSFSAWIIRLLSKFLTEGSLHVEGLVNESFVSAVCSFLCYEDATLHMACFDLVRITMSVVDASVIGIENFIRSIACILQHDEKELTFFRNIAYDSSVGACLHVLHSACQDMIVKSTASEIVSAFPKSLQSTESPELQVALCSAYVRIAKICPIYIWKPAQLISIICSSKSCLALIECIQMAASVLDPGDVRNDHVSSQGVSFANDTDFDIAKVGEKRSAQNNHCQNKRQKIEDVGLFPFVDVHICDGSNLSLTCDEDTKHVRDLQSSLSKFFGFSSPEISKASLLRPEISVMALSLLCIAFCRYPNTSLAISIFQQLFSWIPWICKQEKDTGSLPFGLSTCLVAIDNLLLLQGSIHNKMLLCNGDSCQDDGSGLSFVTQRYDDLTYLLKLPWTNDSSISLADPIWKIKCLSIQVLSKIFHWSVGSNLEVLDMAITDEVEQVRKEAVVSLPVIILCSGHNMVEIIVRRLEYVYQLLYCFLFLSNFT
ncbi:Serine/threonine-protein kinase ATR [Platanthera guangdongensis]|uniref:Serine/threonine-protein kinase ATR n=1 Tax=Platanthera guangdongensis TaxID=2320717 RepID=A0ABR2MKQ0_9ASPA